LSSPFEGYEVEVEHRPAAEGWSFDLERTLSAVVALEATVPDDAFTARTLGTERLGNGVVIGMNGLVLTIGYLINEAQEITLTLNNGRRVEAHALGVDSHSGLGLVQALQPLDLPALQLGDSQALLDGDPVIIAGGGGRAHAAVGKVLTRMPFAGYWEYMLEDAIMTEPAHPHWSGAALIGAGGDLLGIGSLSLQRRLRRGIRPLNMFVPTDLLPPILDDLAQGKAPHPPRPWLGVISGEASDQIVITGVTPGSPASRAELRQGDLILAIDGAAVTDLADFYTRLWALGPAGVRVPLTLQREGDVFDVEVRSADRAGLMRKRRFN
jgi:S1-C subfamily serine protease